MVTWGDMDDYEQNADFTTTAQKSATSGENSKNNK